MLILVLLGMYFDAVVVFVTNRPDTIIQIDSRHTVGRAVATLGPPQFFSDHLIHVMPTTLLRAPLDFQTFRQPL